MLAQALGFAAPEDVALERRYLPSRAEELHPSY